MDDDLEIDDKMRHTFEKVCKRIFVRNENRPRHSKKIPKKIQHLVFFLIQIQIFFHSHILYRSIGFSRSLFRNKLAS